MKDTHGTTALTQPGSSRRGGIPSEEEVMAEYRRLGHVKDHKEELALSAFFDTSRVPTGLTGAQIKICLAKAPLREWHRLQTLGLNGRVYDINGMGRSLPSELRGTEPMTDERFEAGMRKFNDDLITLLAQENVYGLGKTTLDYAEFLVAPLSRS